MKKKVFYDILRKSEDGKKVEHYKGYFDEDFLEKHSTSAKKGVRRKKAE